MEMSGSMFRGGGEVREPGVQLAAVASRPDVVPGGCSRSLQRGQAARAEGEGGVAMGSPCLHGHTHRDPMCLATPCSSSPRKTRSKRHSAWPSRSRAPGAEIPGDSEGLSRGLSHCSYPNTSSK